MHLRNSSRVHPKENIQHFYGQQVSSHPNQNKIYLPSVTLTNKNTIQPSSLKSFNNVFFTYSLSLLSWVRFCSSKQHVGSLSSMFDTFLFITEHRHFRTFLFCVLWVCNGSNALKTYKILLLFFCNSSLLLFEVRHNFKMGIQLCF